MGEFLVITTSPDVPGWVVAEAAGLGVRFEGLDRDASVARQLAARRPEGYLLNWPDLGPYLDGELADAAEQLAIVTYLGQSPEPAFYTDSMDVAALQDRGIVTTHAPDAGHNPVAECAMAFLLALELDLVPANTARKAGSSYPSPVRRHGLSGATLGIVGMGPIGRRVAELAAAHGMRIVYFSRTRRPEVEQALGADFRALPELFATAGYVSVHVPAGPGMGLIDEEVLACADGIGLINTTSIAQVIEPEALLLALERGWVRKVALEGRYAEPYDSRLRAYGDDRVLLMPPYTSYDTPRSAEAGWRSYLSSLAALVNGLPVPHQLGRAR